MTRKHVRRRRSAEREDRPDPSRRKAPPTLRSILSVHRRAGNHAVTRLVQRQVEEEEERIAPYTLNAAGADLHRLVALSSQASGSISQTTGRGETLSSEPQLSVMRKPDGETTTDEAKAEPVNPALQPVITTAKDVVKALRQKLVRVSDQDERKRYLQLLKTFEAFPTTHKLPLLSLRGRIRLEPRFLTRTVESLKKGEEVEVLGVQGFWYQVRSSRNKEGWLHRSRLIPEVVLLSWVGKPGPGTGKDEETEVGGARH